MTALLAAVLLLQSEADVDAWLRGDDRAREKLLEAGPVAVRPLRKLRARSPEKIDALIGTIRRAKSPEELGKALDATRTFEAKDLPVADLPHILSEALATAVFLDPKLPDEAAVKTITVAENQRPVHAILDALCRDAGLDWCVTYGVVLISTPDRIWPAAPAPKPAPLAGDELEKAKRLVEALNAETLDERDTASAALEKLGGAALPLLEANAGREEREIASRCKALAAKLRTPPPRAVFGATGAERQGDAGAAVVDALKGKQITFKVRRLNVAHCLKLLMAQTSVGLELNGMDATPVTLSGENTPVWPMLAILVHAMGCDLAVVGGRVVVDKPEEIEKVIRK